MNSKEKTLFNAIKEASFQNLGVEYSDEISGNKFLIEEIEEFKTYILHTTKFVAEFDCQIHLEDEEKDNGKWFKTYSFTEITKSYGLKKIGFDKIVKFIKNNIKTMKL